MAANADGRDLVAFSTKVDEAAGRIHKYIRRTPLQKSLWLQDCSECCGVYLKMESEQVTNSFKVRGASNTILTHLENTDSLSKQSPLFTTASSGNHGLACAYVCSKLDIPASLTVFVASVASQRKVSAIKRRGVNVVVHGSDCVEAENEARRQAEVANNIFISPYNNWTVVQGQGTIGREIFMDLPSVDAVFVAVGGGGLISGIAMYLKHKNPTIKIIGCQPVNSCVMYRSIQAGFIVEEEALPSLSDGTIGGVEQGTVTFESCRDYVDEWILVSEEEIEYAVYKILEEESKLVEGATGVAVAAFFKTKEKWKGQEVVIVNCGGNIGARTISEVLQKYVK